MSTKDMDLTTFCKKAEADQRVCKMLHAVDTRLRESCASGMLDLFRQIIRQEHENPAQRQALKASVCGVARGAMRYLDSSGVTAAVADVAPLLEGVSYAANACVLAYEVSYLHDTDASMVVSVVGMRAWAKASASPRHPRSCRARRVAPGQRAG